MGLVLALGPITEATLQAQAPASSPTRTTSPPLQQTPGAISDTAAIKVNFPGSPIQAIIPFYTQLTGKKMILDSSLQGDTLRITSPKTLTKKEAVLFIEANLLLNGYVIIPTDDQTVKLIHHSGGKSPTPEGLPVFSSIRDLPEGEQIVHYVMPLEHISPDEASKAFQQVVKLHTYGAITPVSNASAIIITENTATIRSLHEIAQVIDVPPAEIANEMIKLERSDAESIAEIINQIYEEKEKSSNNSPQTQAVAQTPGQPVNVAANARGGVPQPVNPAGIANTANTNPTAARVKVIPYRRTNHILVIARPVDIAYIKGLVEKLDQQTDGVNFMKRKLRFVAVADFLPVAYNALARDTDIQTDGQGAPVGGRSNRPRGSSNTPSTDASRRDSTGLGRSNPFGGGLNGGLSSGSSFSDSNRSLLDDPDQNTSPESVVVGKTLLIGDPQSNSLIVSGSPEHIEIIDKLLQEIDIRPQQIYISTVIGQLNLGGEYKYGFDFLQLLDDFTLRRSRTVEITNANGGTTTITGSGNTNTTNGATTTDTTTVSNPGSTLTTTQTVTDSPGLIEVPLNFKDFNWNQLNLYGQIGSLGRYVNLLEGTKNFKVLSRPSVYATNNGKAVISSGQRIAVPVSTLSNVGIGSTASVSSSIDYRDVVLKLEVVPLINSDDEVTLRIAQLNDNVVGQQTLGGNTIPTIGTQELVTTVTVKNGATVVLGGLITEREGDDGRGVIFLRRIPVIKHLFGTTAKQKNREELLIFIQPNIISSNDHLDTPNNLELGRTRIIEDTLQFGGPEREIRRALPAE